MDYETWDAHTTELQNKHGHTGEPPKGALDKVSLYEFVNDWLRPELQFQIFAYCAKPRVPKKVIADHFRGVGQRYFNTTGRRGWLPLPLHRARLGGTLSPSMLKLDNRDNNLMTLLNGAPQGYTLVKSYWRFTDTYDHPTKAGCKVTKTAIEYALQVNKVKGRTKLYKDWSCNHYNPKTLMDRGYIPSQPIDRAQYLKDCRTCSNLHLQRLVARGADRFRADAATAIVRALLAL